ncbi:transporter substrate-binding domain-containing protein [Desulfobacterales bacterium HSG16]|nr:transporter substrate-binding domain-containing protein [Desulfobacterales bacterium HSG16]
MLQQKGFALNIVFFIFIMLLISFQKTVSEARPLEEIQKTGEIRLCVAGSSHALYTKMGIILAKALGVKPVIRRLKSWDQQFHGQGGVTIKEKSYTPYLMETGECDCYPNDLVMHDWRSKKLDFVLLFKTRMTIVVHNDNKEKFKTEKDLEGKQTAVMKGTTYHTWIEEKNTSDFAYNPVKIQFMTTDNSMMAVEDKQVDFTIIGADGALNWTRNKIKNSVVAFFIGPVTKVGWGFNKQDKNLQAVAAKFFETQRKTNSEFDAIWKEKVGITLSEYTLFLTNLLGK